MSSQLPRFIVSDPAILGGAYVIVGTRVSVEALQQRHWRGEAIEVLCQDYSHVPRMWIEAALRVRLPAHP